MKDILLYFITPLVDFPDEVVIEEQDIEGKLILSVTCNKEDMGKLIGKHGRTIKALRDLLKLVATKRNLYVDIALAEG